jgi:hypothetical protein
VAHTPSGQVVPSGQSPCTGRHSQAAAAAHDGWVAFALHASFTTVTGTAWLLACW